MSSRKEEKQMAVLVYKPMLTQFKFYMFKVRSDKFCLW